jgi:hypothetical protein
MWFQTLSAEIPGKRRHFEGVLAGRGGGAARTHFDRVVCPKALLSTFYNLEVHAEGMPAVSSSLLSAPILTLPLVSGIQAHALDHPPPIDSDRPVRKVHSPK